ncbi:leucine zipper transcription factor-like protein 1 [Convolutriloba macropyga]|uniref:leucine zipper transcription factor-like protein 1 n=1 Tax=Convolutriloba macropyga TaxID=536237 RepID=UPI003F51CF1F
MEKALGLNEHHTTQVVGYMRFSRFKRKEVVKSIHTCFDDVTSGRVMQESTFTQDEVLQILSSLEDQIKMDVEGDLAYAMHTNLLLLRQLFGQSEKWHLKLNADISQLENSDMIEKMKDLESSFFADGSLENKKLDPLESSVNAGPAALLHMKIAELQEQNDFLQSKLKMVENAALSSSGDKKKILQELEDAQRSIDAMKKRSGLSSDEMAQIEAEIADLKLKQGGPKSDDGKYSYMENEMISAKHKLLEAREMLEKNEKELERKFTQTGAYKNLKRMLDTKNSEIKALRQKLSKYESD